MVVKTVDCTIERRLLINYRIDPEVAGRHIPSPFRPLVVSDWAVGGVCLIRLGALRPAHLPKALGLTTENAAHRFAVEWDDEQGTHAGVFIPRRDTNSRITALVGDRLFPGLHHLAGFQVREDGPEIHVAVSSHDGTLELSTTAHESAALGGELFSCLDDAIGFFRRGARGYSPNGALDELAGVRLECPRWDARPVQIDSLRSTMFDDHDAFPKGSCTVDFGLLMQDLPARWVSDGSLGSRPDETLQQLESDVTA
jgi:Uncharacterized conserved protein (COG2071)